jgi:outer membrane protein
MPTFCLTALLALFALQIGRAQAPPTPLTLDDCIQLAQNAPSAVTSAQRDAEISRLGLRQARAAFMPAGAALTGYSYNTPLRNARSTMSYVALNGIREYVGLGQVVLDLDTSGRLRAGVRRARADQDGAAAGLTIARRDLRQLVTLAYYRALLTRRLVGVAGDVLREGQDFQQRVQRMAAGGEAAQADVVRASAEVAFFEQALSNAQLEANLANMDLASFWTTDVATTLSLADPFDDPTPAPQPEDPTLAPYLNRPEFSLLDANRRSLDAESSVIRAQLLPQASLVLQYGLDANQVAINNRGGAVFVAVTVPIFDWFRTRDAAAQARIRAEQASIRAQTAEREFSRDYRNALARVTVLFRQLSTTQAQIQQSTANLRLSRIRYEGGEGSALEVVTAQTQVGQARGNFFTTLANYFIAQSNLAVAAGR